jgi:hypothetical protein
MGNNRHAGTTAGSGTAYFRLKTSTLLAGSGRPMTERRPTGGRTLEVQPPIPMPRKINLCERGKF